MSPAIQAATAPKPACRLAGTPPADLERPQQSCPVMLRLYCSLIIGTRVPGFLVSAPTLRLYDGEIEMLEVGGGTADILGNYSGGIARH